MVSIASDKTVKVWDLKTQENIHTFKHRVNAMGAAINPESIYVWKSKTGKNIPNFAKVLGSDAEFLTTTLDWKTLIGCGGKYSNESHLKVWDFDTGKHLMTLPQRAYSAAISPDGQTIASFSGCGVIKIWRVP